MKNYTDLVNRIIFEGQVTKDRTGVGTLSLFAGQLEFDLRMRFPLVTAKETRWRVAFLEMLWFLRGEPNTSWLNQNGSKLWDAWADDLGNLGPVYGVNWRHWQGLDYQGRHVEVDQLANLIHGLKTNPAGRRHMVTAWNVAQIPDMALPPCHWAFQCYCGGDDWLDMQVYQRSWDIALGAPFNVAQYALLLHMLARATGRKARRLTFCYGDVHLYLNHVDAMGKVANRGPRWGDSAELVFHTDNTDIDGYSIDDFEVINYHPHPFVRLEVAV